MNDDLDRTDRRLRALHTAMGENLTHGEPDRHRIAR